MRDVFPCSFQIGNYSGYESLDLDRMLTMTGTFFRNGSVNVESENLLYQSISRKAWQKWRVWKQMYTCTFLLRYFLYIAQT